MALSLSGVASGIDTASIVAQLMAIERQGKTKLQLRESAIQARETGLKDVRTKLEALRTAAKALTDPALWAETQDIASSDGGRVSATRTGAITPGTYAIEVQRLATIEQRAYAFGADTLSGSTLRITPDTGSAVDVQLELGATVDDAVAAINGKADSPLSAAVVNGKLQLTSKTSGDAGGFTATVTSGGATLTEDVAARRVGVDAAYTVNGQAKTSATSAPTDGVPGMTLGLKALTTGAVTLTVADPKRNLAVIKDKVKALVDAYNAVIASTQAKTSEKRIADADTPSEAGKGQLFADRGLSAMVSTLRREVAAAFTGNPAAMDQLAEVGVTVAKATGGAPSEDAKLGKLVFDEAKLTSGLETNPTGVQRLLGGLSGAPGVGQKIEELVDLQTGGRMVGGRLVKGALDERLTAVPGELDRLRDRMTDMDRRLEVKEKRLKVQFAAMEKALNLAQSQQSWLAGQIAGLTASSG